MSNLDFMIGCTVTFFSKKMTNPPNLNNGKYCPYIVVKDTVEPLSINFIDDEDLNFDESIRADALPVNENVNYSALQVGTEFFIVDGSTIIGVGRVKENFQHKPMGENNHGL